MKEKEKIFEEMVYTPSTVNSSGSSSTGSSMLGILKLNAYVEKSPSGSMYNINYSVSCSNASNINVVLAKHPSGTILERRNYSYGTSSTFFGVDVGSYLVKATASRGSATKSTQLYAEVGSTAIVNDINVSVQTLSYTNPKNVGYDDMPAYWFDNYYITVSSSNAESITASLYRYTSTSSGIICTFNSNGQSAKTSKSLSVTGRYKVTATAKRGTTQKTKVFEFDIVPKDYIRSSLWLSQNIKGNAYIRKVNSVDTLYILGKTVNLSEYFLGTSSIAKIVVSNENKGGVSVYGNVYAHGEGFTKVVNEHSKFCLNDYWDLYRKAENIYAEDITVQDINKVKINGIVVDLPTYGGGCIIFNSNIRTSLKEHINDIFKSAKLPIKSSYATVAFEESRSITRYDDRQDDFVASGGSGRVDGTEVLFFSNNPEAIGKFNNNTGEDNSTEGVDEEKCLADNGYYLNKAAVSNNSALIYVWHTNKTEKALRHAILLEGSGNASNTVYVRFYETSMGSDADCWSKFIAYNSNTNTNSNSEKISISSGERKDLNSKSVDSSGFGTSVGGTYGCIALIEVHGTVNIYDIIYEKSVKNDLSTPAPNEVIYYNGKKREHNYKRGRRVGYHLIMDTPLLEVGGKDSNAYSSRFCYYSGVSGSELPNSFENSAIMLYDATQGTDFSNEGLYGMVCTFNVRLKNNNPQPQNFYIMLGSRGDKSDFVVQYNSMTKVVGSNTCKEFMNYVPAIKVCYVDPDEERTVTFNVVHPGGACAPYVIGVVDCDSNELK